MELPVHKPVSADAFLEWAITQEDRFELVDGFVVRAMAGAKQDHNVVTSNIVAALGAPGQARRLPDDIERHGGADGSVRDSLSRRRRRLRAPRSLRHGGDPPTLVLEVSSPGTSAIDATDKLDEYRGHPTIRLIVFVDPDLVSVKLHRRARDDGWAIEKYDDLARIVDLPEIEASLPLRDIYDTLEPKLSPRLQVVERAAAPDDGTSETVHRFAASALSFRAPHPNLP